MGRSGVATHNFFPKAYQYWDDLNYIAENNEDWRMKITNIELTNDASPQLLILSSFKTFGASLISNIQATPQMMFNI